MKTFVVSLADSLQRREKVDSILVNAKIEFDFFDAVKGADENNESLLGYNDKRSQLECGRSLTLGERGCFASHRTLWLHCIAINEPILIMEDDIYLSSGFKYVANLLDDLAKNYEYFKLGRSAHNKFMGIQGWFDLSDAIGGSDHKMVKYLRNQNGTYSYVITPPAAQKLVESSISWWLPVDKFMEIEMLHGMMNFGIEPPVVMPSDEPSLIGKRRNNDVKNLISKIVVELHRIKYDLFNLISNFKFYINSRLFRR